MAKNSIINIILAVSFIRTRKEERRWARDNIERTWTANCGRANSNKYTVDNAYETCKLSSNHVYFTRQQDENEICRRGQTPNPRGVTIWARSYLLLFPFFN